MKAGMYMCYLVLGHGPDFVCSLVSGSVSEKPQWSMLVESVLPEECRILTVFSTKMSSSSLPVNNLFPNILFANFFSFFRSWQPNPGPCAC